jgi:glycine cleavage system H protein
MSYPDKYRYTREHEWIELDGDTGTIGITDHAQETLGDIVFVEVPAVGAQVEAGKVFGSVESVKAVSDLFSPVTGEIEAVNEELTAAPEKINADAHTAWIMRVKLTNTSEVNALLSAAEYENFVAEEAGH